MTTQSSLSPVSIGSLVKKILAIYPQLEVQDIVQAIRKATRVQESPNDGFGAREITDEALALEFAQAIFASKTKSIYTERIQ